MCRSTEAGKKYLCALLWLQPILPVLTGVAGAEARLAEARGAEAHLAKLDGAARLFVARVLAVGGRRRRDAGDEGQPR